MVQITRKSPFSGKINSMEIDVTDQELMNWHNGMLIQHAMPNLSVDEREFIKTGITPSEWEATFGKGEE